MFNPFKKHDLTHAVDPREFIGRKLKCYQKIGGPPDTVTIKHVQGSLALPGNDHLVFYFVINGTHLCHMLSFFTQMIERREPTQEELNEFHTAAQIKDIKEINEN